MKRLLVLFLVLAAVPTASATPLIAGPDKIDISVGYITLTLQGTSAEASSDNFNPNKGGYTGAVWVDYYDVTYQMSNVSAAQNAMGGMANIDLTTYLPQGGGIFFIAKPSEPWSEDTDVDAGDWFSFDVSTPYGGAEIGDTYDVQVCQLVDNHYFNIVYTHTVTVVPEPITMALLGLGGLFLRRRK